MHLCVLQSESFAPIRQIQGTYTNNQTLYCYFEVRSEHLHSFSLAHISGSQKYIISPKWSILAAQWLSLLGTCTSVFSTSFSLTQKHYKANNSKVVPLGQQRWHHVPQQSRLHHVCAANELELITEHSHTRVLLQQSGWRSGKLGDRHAQDPKALCRWPN